MIDRTVLRAAAVEALKAAATAAGTAVFSPRDWPTTPGSYPLLIVRTPHERKENVAARSGPPTFFTTVTLAVTGRVESVTEADAESQLERLSLQIEAALLANGKFIFDNGIQQFVAVETTMDVRSESEKHYGETVVSFLVEIAQIFDPTIDASGSAILPDLHEMQITLVAAGTGRALTGETINLT